MWHIQWVLMHATYSEIRHCQHAYLFYPGLSKCPVSARVSAITIHSPHVLTHFSNICPDTMLCSRWYSITITMTVSRLSCLLSFPAPTLNCVPNHSLTVINNTHHPIMVILTPWPVWCVLRILHILCSVVRVCSPDRLTCSCSFGGFSGSTSCPLPLSLKLHLNNPV